MAAAAPSGGRIREPGDCRFRGLAQRSGKSSGVDAVDEIWNLLVNVLANIVLKVSLKSLLECVSRWGNEDGRLTKGGSCDAIVKSNLERLSVKGNDNTIMKLYAWRKLLELLAYPLLVLLRKSFRFRNRRSGRLGKNEVPAFGIKPDGKISGSWVDLDKEGKVILFAMLRSKGNGLYCSIAM